MGVDSASSSTYNASTVAANAEASNKERDALLAQQRQQIQDDFKANMQSAEIARQAQQNNTAVTALTTLQKGQDDVMRAIANNLK